VTVIVIVTESWSPTLKSAEANGNSRPIVPDETAVKQAPPLIPVVAAVAAVQFPTIVFVIEPLAAVPIVTVPCTLAKPLVVNSPVSVVSVTAVVVIVFETATKFVPFVPIEPPELPAKHC
jgi:hypothetical protein